MKIRYIDGIRFHRAVVAGAKKVFHRQDHLNKINVFPVPDADTGTNMASTLRSIVDSVAENVSESISQTSKQVADSALNGARGNSGVILAQFFYGLAEELEEDLKIDTDRFAAAVENAFQRSYEALMQPKEGTILTVIRDWADGVREHSHKNDFNDVLHHALERAKITLQKTGKTLEAARKAKVVDAGAQGFVDFMQGITDFIGHGKIREILKISHVKSGAVAHTDVHPETITFRYCTEGMIEGENINLQQIREELDGMGDSMIVAGSPQKVRIHIHTNEPATVFTKLYNYGKIIQQKVEDMVKQFRVSHGEHAKIALVVDSACDLPDDFIEENLIHIVPMKLIFGTSSFLDKITITPTRFYEMLLSEAVHPRTSQPSPADFTNLYSFLLSHYESVISLSVTGSSSGTFQNAVNAASRFPDRNITVIDTKNLSVGFGLIARRAADLIAAGKDHIQVVEAVKKAVLNTRVLVYIDNLKFLMKSGRVSKAKGLLAKVLNLKPLLRVDEIGTPVHDDKAFSEKQGLKKLVRKVETAAADRKDLTIMVVHAAAPERAEWVVARLKEILGERDIPVLPVAPALGAHAGAGAVAVGINWS